MGMPPSTDLSSANNERSQMFDLPCPQQSEDRHGSQSPGEKKKAKKLDDGLYDYIETLPGQTQQLMQLHHVSMSFCFMINTQVG